MLKPDKKRSRGYLVLIAVWLALLGYLFYEMFGPPSVEILAKKPVLDTRMDTAAGSQGASRRKHLEAATQEYLKSHPDAAAAIVDGRAYAPAEYLNARLAREHLKWRVRSVDGLTVSTYSIS